MVTVLKVMVQWYNENTIMHEVAGSSPATVKAELSRMRFGTIQDR